MFYVVLEKSCPGTVVVPDWVYADLIVRKAMIKVQCSASTIIFQTWTFFVFCFFKQRLGVALLQVYGMGMLAYHVAPLLMQCTTATLAMSC